MESAGHISSKVAIATGSGRTEGSNRQGDCNYRLRWAVSLCLQFKCLLIRYVNDRSLAVMNSDMKFEISIDAIMRKLTKSRKPSARSRSSWQAFPNP